MTIGAPQQLSIPNTKIRTTSTAVHKARDGAWQMDHLLRYLSVTIGPLQQFSILDIKIGQT
jgi:hypothetical protein